MKDVGRAVKTPRPVFGSRRFARLCRRQGAHILRSSSNRDHAATTLPGLRSTVDGEQNGPRRSGHVRLYFRSELSRWIHCLKKRFG